MKVAIVYTRLGRGMGGGEYVTEQIIRALEEYEHLTFFCIYPEKFKKDLSEELLNRIEFKKIDLPTGIPLRDSERLQLLKEKIAHRYISKEVKSTKKDFDLIFVSTKLFGRNNFETPTIQYIHNADEDFERSSLKKAYDFFLNNILGDTTLNANKNLFNSRYIKNTYSEIDGEVLHPPVQSDLSPSKSKEEQAIIVGRICPDKNIKEAISIVSNLDLELVVAGRVTETNLDYLKELRKLEEKYTWLTVKTDLPREELTDQIEKSKVGISAKEKEPFGIVAVEYLKAGVLPMVRANSGTSEIVQRDRFIYSNQKEATEKIRRNLRKYENLRKFLITRGDKFTEEEFRENISDTVEELLD